MSLIKIEYGGEATTVTCQVDILPDVFHDSCKRLVSPVINDQ